MGKDGAKERTLQRWCIWDLKKHIISGSGVDGPGAINKVVATKTWGSGGGTKKRFTVQYLEGRGGSSPSLILRDLQGLATEV